MAEKETARREPLRALAPFEEIERMFKYLLQMQIQPKATIASLSNYLCD